MGERTRSFLCIEPEPALRDTLKCWLDSLKSLAPKLRWVHSDAVHLTLKFLGEQPPEKLTDLRNRIPEALSAKSLRTFYLELSGVGAFPNYRSPRVLWMDLSGETDALRDLWETLENLAVRMGFPPETRPFRPHLTLARIKDPGDFSLALAKTLTEADPPMGRWKVGSVTLMRSELRAGGPLYSPLATFPLYRV
jgi:2'-5' RNA ligase